MSETPRISKPFIAGDQLPAIGFRYPGDLTGFTVTFSLERPGDGDNIQRAATVTSPETGAGIIQWQSGDLVAGCDQRAIITFTDPAGRPLSFDFYIDVEPSIAPGE